MDDFSNLSDIDLVNLSLKNPDNFKFIVEKYSEPIFKYIKRLANVSDEQAEDLLQEIFIKVYVNLNSFNKDLKFSSWIYRIAHNYVISFFRKTKNKKLFNIYDESLVRNLISDFDIKKKIDLDYQKKNIFEIFEKMRPIYKQVLILKYLEGKSNNEISDILKKPPGTIAVIINRAKKQFKKFVLDNNKFL